MPLGPLLRLPSCSLAGLAALPLQLPFWPPLLFGRDFLLELSESELSESDSLESVESELVEFERFPVFFVEVVPLASPLGRHTLALESSVGRRPGAGAKLPEAVAAFSQLMAAHSWPASSASAWSGSQVSRSGKGGTAVPGGSPCFGLSGTDLPVRSAALAACLSSELASCP